MKGKKWLTVGLGFVAALAVSVYWKLHGRPTVIDGEAVYDEPGEPVEAVFLREWTAVLGENARVFNGLFGGLLRVRDGAAKRPEKVLREWCQRAHYRWENEPVDTLCREQILPLIDGADVVGLKKWAGLLLEAAAAAGISKDDGATLVLTARSAEGYIDWDGGELYPEDVVEILSPAWYQNGRILEQGQCRKRNPAE
ncbi:MAG: hypothetical protein IJ422_03725 [Oscillospiraceae bacterium]|nr:hypothetical protein [Oscillospiraceae bacterium]